MKIVYILLFNLNKLILNFYSQEPPIPDGQETRQSRVSNPMSDSLRTVYSGEWENIDSNTQMVTKVIISNNNEFSGSCLPIDCYQGKVKIHEIAKDIGVYNIPPFDYCLAIWETFFADTIMKITIGTETNPKLYIESITVLKDDSGRSDYHY